MKILIPLMAAAVLFTACTSESQKTPTSSSANTNSVPYVITTSQDAQPANVETVPNNATAKALVEFTYVGITPDKENFSYKIKVNTDRPISQVDIAVKYYDDKGKVLGDSTIAWQNVVKSTRQPIEQGKVYEATGYLEPGSTKVEAVLNRVVFKDGSSWSAP